MGTRHIVEVIRGNKTVIRQYGQWDGYAETAAYHLRNYLKNHGTERLNRIIDQLVQVNVTKHDETKPDDAIGTESLTPHLAHIYESFMQSFDQEIADKLFEIKCMGHFDIDMFIAMVPVLVQKYGFERTAMYYTLTRDTGYKILDVLDMLYSCKDHDKIPVYLEDKDTETGRSIIINLDDDTFTCDYFGNRKTWPTLKLPTLKELKQLDK